MLPGFLFGALVIVQKLCGNNVQLSSFIRSYSITSSP